MLTNTQIDELKDIRRELHTIPEISGAEKKTAAYIKEKLRETGADEIKDQIGGQGIIAVYKGSESDQGKTLMIRAELDALAIDEQNEIPYKSATKNRMHACGHDGHMAIVLGVGIWLKENRPAKGRVILLFQPSEETGEGAGRMMENSEFKKIKIDRGIALHNLPGYKKNTIYIRSNSFALASVGVKIRFLGKSSHAAFPREGINPSAIIAKLIEEFEEIKTKIAKGDQFQVLTITYIKVGEPAFGINPGTGEVGITIRAETDEAIDQLYSKVEQIIHDIRSHFGGDVEYEKKEPFAATVNDQEGVDQLKKVAETVGVNVETLEKPIAWSEDFGEFRKKCSITLFGLGAGEDIPSLHSEQYDFDDDLISTGVSVFCKWIKEELNGP